MTLTLSLPFNTTMDPSVLMGGMSTARSTDAPPVRVPWSKAETPAHRADANACSNALPTSLDDV